MTLVWVAMALWQIELKIILGFLSMSLMIRICMINCLRSLPTYQGRYNGKNSGI